MLFKVVKEINHIGEINLFKKPNILLCTEEWLMILKNIHDQNATQTNKKS